MARDRGLPYQLPDPSLMHPAWAMSAATPDASVFAHPQYDLKECADGNLDR
jgi:hypothetical protein